MKAIEIRPIRCEADYERALASVESLMDGKRDCASDDALEVLATLIETYEEKHHPVSSPDPSEAIRERMEALALSRKDLEPIFGGRGRVSEILSRKRGLSLAMIRAAHDKLGLSLETLFQPYEIRGE